MSKTAKTNDIVEPDTNSFNWLDQRTKIAHLDKNMFTSTDFLEAVGFTETFLNLVGVKSPKRATAKCAHVTTNSVDWIYKQNH